MTESNHQYLINIDNVQVSFPHKPYKVQEDYMIKVVECLQKGVNGLLESPTGTGKTLSLLCSTLAWLENRKAMTQAAMLEQRMVRDPNGSELINPGFFNIQSQLKGVVGNVGSNDSFRTTKIVYSSRTHSQLSQVVQELRKTNYKHLPAVVLGSRDQLCLHPEVSKLQSNAAKLHSCRSKVNSRTCSFYLNVEHKVSVDSDYTSRPVLDIEDLVTLGKKHVCCPYYSAKMLKNKADVIFTPYNYLLDPKSRKAHGIDLQDSVVIFDEAHNIENVCEDSMSFQLKSAELALCINEVTQALEKMRDSESIAYNPDTASLDFTVSDLSILKVMFCELEEHLDKLSAEGGTSGITRNGNFIFELLSKVELTPQKKDIVLDLVDKVIQFLTDTNATSWMTKGAGLQKFADMLKVLFTRAFESGKSTGKAADFDHKYKIFLQQDIPKPAQGNMDVWTVTNKTSKRNGWILNCWCFSPGLCMQDLMEQQVHCLILTSGTLSPLVSFATELGIPFPVQLENPHIIEDHQVFVAAITQGPDSTTLNSTFQNRSDPKYLSSMGRTVQHFSRLTPDGMLVFFPSYAVLKLCVNHWQETGIWENMCAAKSMFTEPQGRDAFQESIEKFYSKISEENSNGAALLAVCRGKVSEGLDFADRNARGVIITGLPFAPAMDQRIKLKKSYLDENKIKGLSGKDWYMLQASRAVNQAIGRVIRHKHDFGAVLLCDNRFADKHIQNQLSLWVRGRIRVYNSFGPALRDLRNFFRNLQAKPISHLPNMGNALSCNSSVATTLMQANKLTKVAPKSKCTDSKEVEPDIVQNYILSIPSNSQEKPSASKRKQSIFDAFESCESRMPSTVAPVSGASSNLCLPVGPDVENSSRSTVKKRKINVQYRSLDGDKEPQTKEDLRTVWKKRIARIKLSLCAEDYAKFTAAVKKYKASSKIHDFTRDIIPVLKSTSKRETVFEILCLLVDADQREDFRRLANEDMKIFARTDNGSNADDDSTPPSAQPQ